MFVEFSAGAEKYRVAQDKRTGKAGLFRRETVRGERCWVIVAAMKPENPRMSPRELLRFGRSYIEKNAPFPALERRCRP